MPVIGKSPRLTPALIITWAKIMVIKPSEKSLAKLLSALAAIEPILNIKAINRLNNSAMPASPNFLAKFASAKSLYGSGTIAFCETLLSNAMPIHFPEPNVTLDCMVL